MAFKIGSNTILDNTSNNPYAYTTGHYNVAGTDLGNLIRYTTYTDDLANNCNGYMPNGNCAGNAHYTPPNGNWWTWGVSGIPGGNCGNALGHAGNANCSTAYYPVSVSYNYDAYYELYNRIRGSEQHRNYRNCNCGNCVGNCYTNCDCDCACQCACNC